MTRFDRAVLWAATWCLSVVAIAEIRLREPPPPYREPLPEPPREVVTLERANV